MRLHLRVRALLSGVFFILAAACHDAPTQPHPQSPLVGQWMLETHPDTFVFVTGPSSTDCPGYDGYCLHYRSAGDSVYLGGMVQVQDSLGMTGVVATSVQVTGMLTQRFCDSVDYYGLTNCTHAGPARSSTYVGGIGGAPDSTTTQSLNIYTNEVIPGTSTGRALTMLGATYARDSIYGRFIWGVPGHEPTYFGSFVMRRVR